MKKGILPGRPLGLTNLRFQLIKKYLSLGVNLLIQKFFIIEVIRGQQCKISSDQKKLSERSSRVKNLELQIIVIKSLGSVGVVCTVIQLQEQQEQQ